MGVSRWQPAMRSPAWTSTLVDSLEHTPDAARTHQSRRTEPGDRGLSSSRHNLIQRGRSQLRTVLSVDSLKEKNRRRPGSADPRRIHRRREETDPAMEPGTAKCLGCDGRNENCEAGAGCRIGPGSYEANLADDRTEGGIGVGGSCETVSPVILSRAARPTMQSLCASEDRQYKGRQNACSTKALHHEIHLSG